MSDANDWGEPSAQPTDAMVKAETDRLRIREETRRTRAIVAGWAVGAVAAAAVLLGITGAIMRGHEADVAREKATAVACAQAGNSWVENSSGTMECRKA